MSTNLPSMRFPLNVRGKVDDSVAEALEYHDDAITDLQQAIPELKSQIKAATASTTSTTENVTETNQQTVVTGSSVGGVNNQVGVTAYATAQSDYGAFILLSDASAIAVTLTAAPVITLPWYATLINSGTGTATLTPASGTINGAGSFALLGGQCVTVVFDGTNFEIVPLLALPVNTAGVSHEWIASYNASTGVFTLSQPAFTDISGVATTAQIGTGTPSAGDYVDGGTGAWTVLPSSGASVISINGQTTNYVAVVGDLGKIIQMNSGSATVVTLPVTFATGFWLWVKNVGAGTCTVAAASGDIDADASIPITQWQAFQFYWDGSAWHQLSQSLSV